ncbi:MAG: hypothetical protein NTV34_18045 [Proteobacteria bacterium]|nr:hypothetical protein [Pseudomonadota bacterium]
MKNVVRHQYACFAVLAGASLAGGVHAGVGSSGGGFAVVCRGNDHAIQSAQVLDLFEAQKRGVELRKSSSDINREYALSLKYIRQSGDDHRPIGQTEMDQFQADINNYFVFLPDGLALGSTSDLGEIPTVPAGCAIEQLAVYHDSEQRIEVSSEIWGALDSLNRVALFTHESLYYLYRQAGESTSENLRKLIPYFFQKDLPTSQTAGVPVDSPNCYSENLNSETTFGSHFYYYPDENSAHSTVLQFDNLLGRYTFFPTRVTLPIVIEPGQIHITSNQGKVYSMVSDPSADQMVRAPILEGPFAGYSVLVHYQYLHPFTVTLVDPSGRVNAHHAGTICYPLAHGKKSKPITSALNSSKELEKNAPLTVKVSRDFNFGWINPSDPGACTKAGSETMLIEVTGEPGGTYSVAPLGSPVLRSMGSAGEGEDKEIKVASVQLNPSSVGTLDANGHGVVEVAACRDAASQTQKRGWYSMQMFNVQFQYTNPL